MITVFLAMMSHAFFFIEYALEGLVNDPSSH